LSFPLDALLRDDIHDVAVFGEDSAKGFDEGRDLDALVDVADLDCAVSV